MKTIKALTITIAGIACYMASGIVDSTVLKICLLILGTGIIGLPAFKYWKENLE